MAAINWIQKNQFNFRPKPLAVRRPSGVNSGDFLRRNSTFLANKSKSWFFWLLFASRQKEQFNAPSRLRLREIESVKPLRQVSYGVPKAIVDAEVPVELTQSSRRKKSVLHCFSHNLSVPLCHSVRVPMYKSRYRLIHRFGFRLGEIDSVEPRR